MPARWAIVPFEEIERKIPKSGTIVDIGCGEGVLTTLLALSSAKRLVIGIDINKRKVDLARSQTKKVPNLSFKLENALSKNLPRAEAYVLSDFIHHIPAKQHRRLLANLASNLENKGLIIIKEIDFEDRLRSKISRFFDFIFYPFQEIYLIKSEELSNYFEKNGFKVSVLKLKKWFPGSTTLFICQKKQ